MTLDNFLLLLLVFSSLSVLTTEGVKRKFLKDKEGLSYNIIALVISMIIGSAGCYIYYQLNNIAITFNSVIYMILMGISSGVCSMVEYDKIKQTIIQLSSIKK